MSASLTALPPLAHLPGLEKTPSRLRILNWGENPNVKGVRCFVGDKTARVLEKNQVAAGYDRVALDYEHNTVPGSTAYEKGEEPRPVAGHFSVECVPGDGIYLVNPEWTTSGLRNLENFSDLSAAVFFDDAGEVILVHSAALCRQGNVYGIHKFSVEAIDENSLEGNEMDVEQLKKDLGLDALMDRFAALEARLGEMNTAEPEKDPQVEAMSVQLEDVSTKLGNLANDTRKALDAFERKAILTEAKFQGKVLPLSVEKINELSLEGLRELVDRTKATIPTQQKTPETLSVDSQKEQAARCARVREKATQISNAEGVPYQEAWRRAEALVS